MTFDELLLMLLRRIPTHARPSNWPVDPETSLRITFTFIHPRFHRPEIDAVVPNADVPDPALGWLTPTQAARTQLLKVTATPPPGVLVLTLF